MSAVARFARTLYALAPAAVTFPAYAANEITTQTDAPAAGRAFTLDGDDRKKRHRIQLASATNGGVVGSPSPNIDKMTVSPFTDVPGGRPAEGYRGQFATSAHPDGGKLFITTQWPDGRETKQTLDYTPNDVDYDEWGPFVDFDWDPVRKQFVVTVPESKRPLVQALEIYGGFGRLKHDAPSIGVNVGPDTALLKGPDKIDFAHVGVGVSLGRIGPFAAKLNADFRWGDESTHSDTAAGNRGFTFQGGPNGGSTGVASIAPSMAMFDTKYDSQKLTLTLSRPFPKLEQTDASRVRWDMIASFNRSQFRYDGDMRFPAIPTVFAQENTKVTEYTAGIGLGVGGRHTFPCGLALMGMASLSALYYWGEYDGSHFYGLPGGTFSQSTDDRKSGATWGMSAGVAASYRLTKSIEMFLRGDYEYRDKSVFLQPRVSPSQPAPHLKTGDTYSARVSIGVRYGF